MCTILTMGALRNQTISQPRSSASKVLPFQIPYAQVFSSPATSPKTGVLQFQPLTHFGPQREFERPRYSPKVRFQTLAKRRMGRGGGKSYAKRVCDVLKKDLRKRRKFDPRPVSSTELSLRTRLSAQWAGAPCSTPTTRISACPQAVLRFRGHVLRPPGVRT